MTSGKARRVEPGLPRGTQDFLPETALARQEIIERIRRAYESHGFGPLITPALENWASLAGAGGDEATGQIFRVECGEPDHPTGLRFDLTVPLARVVAANQQEIPRPFRRYQVGSVWRVDKPGPGRFRQFTQFDADIVGTTSPVADAACLAAARDALRAVLPAPPGAPARFEIRMSDRRILDAVLTKAGIPADRAAEVLRVVDKLDRLGMDKVRLELTTGYKDESGDPIRGLGLSALAVDTLAAFLAIRAPDRAATLDAIRAFLGDAGDLAARVDGVAEFSAALGALGVPDDEARFDVAIARGLAYYTGPVFEIALPEAASFGSIGGGGRYDDLVSRFSGQPWPGVGISIGVDRLLAALTHSKGLPATPPSADVLVTTMDGSRLADYAAMCSELRGSGLRVELYAGPPGSLGKQLKHADKAGVPVALIAGSDEFARGVVTLKVMKEPAFGDETSRAAWLAARQGQSEVQRADIVRAVRAALEAPGA